MTQTRTAAQTRPADRGDRRGPATRTDRRGPGRQAALAPAPAVRDGAAARPVRVLAPHEVFAERLLAVLSGARPVHWMIGRAVGDAYEQLVRLAPATPLRTRGARPVIRRCKGFNPRRGVVEAFATVAAGDQVRAMAFRLELGADLKWRCTAVELGGDRV
ncbi:Rv3235 family protein [Streptomyces sp. NPDC001941]|uniref:Rv3235 family protein n=1 Tax=Streptomyces sp. NPDC001941 TaxID=3154659 RepID=UPI00331D79F0